MFKKGKIIFVLVILLALFTFGCDAKKGKQGSTETQEITFSEGLEKFAVDETKNLSVILKYADLESEITFTSSDATILSIEGNTAKALKEGTVVVTATDTKANVSKDITITVENKKVLLLDFDIENKDDFKVGLNEIKKIKVVYDKNADTNFTYTSKDTLVATVDKEGNVRGINDGETTITVLDTVSNISKEFKVVVGLGDTLSAQMILDWAIEQVGTRGYDTIYCPTQYANVKNAKITWSSDNEEVDFEECLLPMVDVSEVINIKCSVEYNGVKVNKTIKYTVVGYTIAEMSTKFERQFRTFVDEDMEINTTYDEYEGYVEWFSLNPEVLDDAGKFTKPAKDTTITITYTCYLNDGSDKQTYTLTRKVDGKSLVDVFNDVEEWMLRDLKDACLLNKNVTLPTEKEINGVTVYFTWYDNDGNILTNDYVAKNPITDTAICSKVICKDNKSNKYEFRHIFKADYTYNETNMWNKIELFLKTISESKFYNQAYGGKEITAYYNKGYIPFYDPTPLDITEDIIPYTDGRCRNLIAKPASSTHYIVVHDTGGSGSGADAAYHNRYLHNVNNGTSDPDRYVSWHYVIDDKECYQNIPLDEVAYHAGDGSRTYGQFYYNEDYDAFSIGGGNRNGIGIESCIHQEGDYAYTMRRLAKLVAGLLIEFNLDVTAVKQHNDFSGKNCPWIMRYTDRWGEFLRLVKIEYFGMTQLQGVTFEWLPQDSRMDSLGRMSVILKNNETISYKVKATYQGETKEFTYTVTYTNKH